MKSESIKELSIALSKAQMGFKPIKRTVKVGYDTTKGRKQYNYAPLNEIIDATKQALSDNGLAITQLPELVDGNTVLETLLSHSSGEWISSKMYVGRQDQPPQIEGSALTYKRRYSISAILGVASEDDDDGEIATDAKPEIKEPVKAREKPEPTAPAPTKEASNKITEAQTKKIYVSVKEKGITADQVKAYLKKIFNKMFTKELTISEASRLIEDIEAGKIGGESALVKAAKNMGAEVIEEGGK